MSKVDEDAKKKATGVAFVIFLIIILTPIILLFKWAGSGSDNNKPVAKFDTTGSSVGQPLNPATAIVEVHVQNVSQVAGSPTCLVQVYDDSNTYYGSDTFTPGMTLQPGEKSGFRAEVTVTNQGAAYAREGKVGCY